MAGTKSNLNDPIIFKLLGNGPIRFPNDYGNRSDYTRKSRGYGRGFSWPFGFTFPMACQSDYQSMLLHGT
jgi:hypothetical protein